MARKGREVIMNIKELRTKAGLTQAQFAELLGCSKRAVESWEGGKREPPAYLVKLIEYYLKHENKI
jgi:DNA-binding transcriptional regulator YiaG